MEQQYLELQLINEQNKAKLNLLKCSESFGLIERQSWDVKLTRANIKSKRKDVTRLIKLKNKTVEPKATSNCEGKNQSNRQDSIFKIKKQFFLRDKRRYTIEHEESSPQFSRKKTEYPTLEPLKAFITNARVPLQSHNFINQRSQSKSALIHMLKNKSTNLNLKTIAPNERNIIHNLSNIKVRIMTKKMQESRVINDTYKELKSKLDSITLVQSPERRKNKSQAKQNRVYLSEILSKRYRQRFMKENLKISQ